MRATFSSRHADRAKMLPGVDMTKLSQEQRDAALHKFNAESCDCGCKFTLAQCRIYDPDCQISQRRTAEIVKKIAAPAADPPKADVAPAAPASTTPTPIESAKP